MQRACCKEGKQTLLSEESREAEVMSFTPLLPRTASIMFCSTIIYQQTSAKRRFFQLLTNMWNESPSASMVFLPHKGGFVAFFYCEMLHIDFLHVDFLSFFLSWGTFTSFLLTHRPQSDKLLWYIPVGAGGDPHPPDTLGLVLPICRSNWNTWTINFFSSPPRLWKEKGSHPNKSVTSPECMHLFYTWWLSSCCRLQPRFLSLPTPFAWASRGCAYKMCCNLTNHSVQPVQWRSFVVVRCRIVALGVTFTTFGENLPYSYSQGLWSSSDLTLGAL